MAKVTNRNDLIDHCWTSEEASSGPACSPMGTLVGPFFVAYGSIYISPSIPSSYAMAHPLGPIYPAYSGSAPYAQ